MRGSATHFLYAAVTERKDVKVEKTYLQQVGERLHECRTRNFFSRKELAEKADVPISSVKMMKRGEAAIGIDEATKICNVLGCSTEFMLTGNYGMAEFAKLYQKIMNLPDINSDNLQKIVRCFGKAAQSFIVNI